MTDDYVIIDWETRSPCPIEYGAHNYAADGDTEILCLGWRAASMDRAEVWLPGQPIDLRLAALLEAAADGRVYVVAHNAMFDRLIYEYIAVQDFNFPQLPPEAWYCSMAEARANALPGGLDKALRAALNNPQARGKDHRGGALIKECCVPPYNEDPEVIAELVIYCLRDVDATAELLERTEPLSATHLTEYHVNERVNDRGVMVDVQLAKAATRYADVETDAIGARLAQITGNEVTRHTQTQRMRSWTLEWLNELMGNRQLSSEGRDIAAEMRNAMVVYKNGELKYSLDKATRADILLLDDEHAVLPRGVREALELYDAGNASSVAKFKRMAELADPDDHRVRGAFLFAGAGQTLRFSSKGLQLHNFRRDCFKAEVAERVRAAMLAKRDTDAVLAAAGMPKGNIMQVLAMLLRPAIIPAPGCVLVVFDWSAIEARVLPWLAASPGADAVLELFRTGADVYVHVASGIYGMPLDEIDPDMRQVGKVAVLSLGFGGAAGALSAMARAYGLALSDRMKDRTVTRWRATNQWAVQFWDQLMKAFRKAWRSGPDSEVWYAAGRVAYQRRGPHVFVRLPCGTELCYPHVHPDEDGYTYAKGALTPKKDARIWPRARLWHGVLAENITQATAASLLRWLLTACEERHVPIVGHTHDEVISEVPRSEAEATAETLHTLMTSGPAWAEGLPLAAEGGVMERYGK